MGDHIVPEWLADINEPLDLSGPDWRERQQDVLALPPWMFEPTETVRHYLELEPDPRGRPPEVDEEDQEELYEHLAQDPVAFANFCGWYKDRDTQTWKRGDLTPGQLVILWRFAILWHRNERIRMALLKQRRGGFSYIIGGIISGWIHLMHENRGGLSAANDVKPAWAIHKYVETIYERMPAWMRPTQKYFTKNIIYLKEKDPEELAKGNFGLDSAIEIASAGGKFLGTGLETQFAHLAEMGKYDGICDIGTLWASLTNTIPESPRSVLFPESTAHGAGTFWHKFWTDCMKMGGRGWNGFTPIFIPWYFDPRNSIPCPEGIEWYDKDNDEYGNEEEERAKYNLSDDQLFWRRLFIQKQVDDEEDGALHNKVDVFRQEYPGNPAEAWLFASGMWINRDIAKIVAAVSVSFEESVNLLWEGHVHHQRGKLPEKAKFESWSTGAKGGPFRVWRAPWVTSEYILGADISSGQAKDKASLWMYEWQPDGMKIAAEWTGYATPYELAHIMWRIGHWYMEALLNWERTGPGMPIGEYIRHHEESQSYPPHRLYQQPKRNAAKGRPSVEYGTNTSGSNKIALLNNWVDLVRNGRMEITKAVAREAIELTRERRGAYTVVDTGGRDRFMGGVFAAIAYRHYQPNPHPPIGPEQQHKEFSVLWADKIIHDGLKRQARRAGLSRNVISKG